MFSKDLRFYEENNILIHLTKFIRKQMTIFLFLNKNLLFKTFITHFTKVNYAKNNEYFFKLIILYVFPKVPFLYFTKWSNCTPTKLQHLQFMPKGILCLFSQVLFLFKYLLIKFNEKNKGKINKGKIYYVLIVGKCFIPNF